MGVAMALSDGVADGVLTEMFMAVRSTACQYYTTAKRALIATT